MYHRHGTCITKWLIQHIQGEGHWLVRRRLLWSCFNDFLLIWIFLKKIAEGQPTGSVYTMSLAHFVLQRKCLCFSVVHWANSISMVGHMKWYIVANCFTCFCTSYNVKLYNSDRQKCVFLIIYKFEVKHILNDSSKRQHANSYKSCMHRFKIKFIVC